MAGRVQVTWVDLVNSTHLAAAFSYDSVDQIIGTCILLLYSLPVADKPSLVNPVPIEWATAVDRHRYEVHSSTQVRKHHEKGMTIHCNGSPGFECLDPPHRVTVMTTVKMDRNLASPAGSPPGWGPPRARTPITPH